MTTKASWSSCGTLFLLFVSGLAAVNASNESSTRDCKHGTWNPVSKACDCFEHWATAGITDILDFLEGTCEQYHCQSDSECQRVLQIEGATCPVPRWNCYCGWQHAFDNFGHGYETPDIHGAECMGLMYTFSVWATQWVEWLLLNVWKVALLPAVLLLPFGRKRAICDHQWPSLWNGIRSCCRCMPTCRGECVLNAEYTLDTLKDDLAWTVYVLDVLVWVYLFLLTLWVVTMFVWSLVLWCAVVVALLCTLLAGLVAACGEGAGGLAGCDCGGCGDCDCNCFGFEGAGAGDATAGSDAIFYWSGPFPLHTGSSGISTSREDAACCGSLCNLCCKPFAWLFFVFPVLPENAWGGLCGRFVFGTHQHTPPSQLYSGGNPGIEFFRMGWRRPGDLHGDASWRRQVRDFLLPAEGPGPRAMPNQGPRFGRQFTSMDVEEAHRLLVDNEETTVITIGRAHAICVDRPFDLEGDRCIRSSFEDYANNKCWICMGDNNGWDLWLSCHHLFCKDCSTEMLHRRMPCPLCRVASSAVLRGRAL